jgi:hypothetical protein
VKALFRVRAVLAALTRIIISKQKRQDIIDLARAKQVDAKRTALAKQYEEALKDIVLYSGTGYIQLRVVETEPSTYKEDLRIRIARLRQATAAPYKLVSLNYNDYFEKWDANYRIQIVEGDYEVHATWTMRFRCEKTEDMPSGLLKEGCRIETTTTIDRTIVCNN